MRVKETVDMMDLTKLNAIPLIELLILSLLVNNTSNNSVKRKALKNGLPLKDFLNHARNCEHSEQQLKKMNDSGSISFIKGKKKQQQSSVNQQKNSQPTAK